MYLILTHCQPVCPHDLQGPYADRDDGYLGGVPPRLVSVGEAVLGDGGVSCGRSPGLQQDAGRAKVSGTLYVPALGLIAVARGAFAFLFWSRCCPFSGDSWVGGRVARIGVRTGPTCMRESAISLLKSPSFSPNPRYCSKRAVCWHNERKGVCGGEAEFPLPRNSRCLP